MNTICYSLLLICLIGMFACDKEEGMTDCSRLEGTWTGTSWTEDAIQLFGDTSLIISSSLRLKKLMEGQGDVEWDISYSLGGPEKIIGWYEVDDNCDLVTITPKGGVGTTYSFSFEGDQLFLVSMSGNTEVELQFHRD